LISVLIGRPLAGVFAGDTYPFPPAVKGSNTFRRVFSRVSIVWGVYLLSRSALRIIALMHLGVEAFIVINVVTGLPFTAAIMAWSIWYGVRGFRQSDEWGAFLRERARGSDDRDAVHKTAHSDSSLDAAAAPHRG
jgi:hypothetical protein